MTLLLTVKRFTADPPDTTKYWIFLMFVDVFADIQKREEVIIVLSACQNIR